MAILPYSLPFCSQIEAAWPIKPKYRGQFHVQSVDRLHKVSPGCDHCYAEALATRYGWARWGKHPRYRTSVANWNKPRAWNADGPRFRRIHGHRRRVFCASLADVFDNGTPKEWRADLFALIHATRELDWQILTKRPQNIGKMLPADWADGYPNVWLGTTTEDQKHYRLRWPVLREIPALPPLRQLRAGGRAARRSRDHRHAARLDHLRWGERTQRPDHEPTMGPRTA